MRTTSRSHRTRGRHSGVVALLLGALTLAGCGESLTTPVTPPSGTNNVTPPPPPPPPLPIIGAPRVAADVMHTPYSKAPGVAMSGVLLVRCMAVELNGDKDESWVYVDDVNGNQEPFPVCRTATQTPILLDANSTAAIGFQYSGVAGNNHVTSYYINSVDLNQAQLLAESTVHRQHDKVDHLYQRSANLSLTGIIEARCRQISHTGVYPFVYMYGFYDDGSYDEVRCQGDAWITREFPAATLRSIRMVYGGDGGAAHETQYEVRRYPG